VLPEHEDEEGDDDTATVAEPTSTIRPPRELSMSTRNVLIAATAIAASLLVVVVWIASRPGDGENSIVAQAQQELDGDRPRAAFDRIERYLSENEDIDDADRTTAQRLLEESGYQVARKELEAGDADAPRRVVDIEARASLYGGVSGRMTNLRIQAGRGASEEHSLSRRPALIDYGYETDGYAYSKEFPKIDDTTERIEDEFVAAIAEHPDSIDLHLNFGQFLLEQNDFERSAAQFAAAVKLDSKQTAAHNGLGLALFQQETDESIEQALGHFRKAVELSPDDPAVNLNLAVCLSRLGRTEEANPNFDKVPGTNP